MNKLKMYRNVLNLNLLRSALRKIAMQRRKVWGHAIETINQYKKEIGFWALLCLCHNEGGEPSADAL